MAQTIAAHVGLLKRAAGLPPKMGVLLGTRRFNSTISAFTADHSLRICSEVVLRDASGLGAYECRIESNGEEVATATLKVYEPEDFQSFLQASHP